MGQRGTCNSSTICQLSGLWNEGTITGTFTNAANKTINSVINGSNSQTNINAVLNNGIANINISSRGNLSKENLSKYLNDKNHKKFNIDTSCIKQIKIIPNERKKLLQLADCCCSALFQALKYNNDIHFDYIKRIQHKLYSKGNNILSYGLKLVPNGSDSIELKNLINFLFKQTK